MLRNIARLTTSFAVFGAISNLFIIGAITKELNITKDRFSNKGVKNSPEFKLKSRVYSNNGAE